MPFRQEPLGPPERVEDGLENVFLPGMEDDLLLLAGDGGEEGADPGAQLVDIPAFQGGNVDDGACAGQLPDPPGRDLPGEVGLVEDDKGLFSPVFPDQPFVLLASGRDASRTMSRPSASRAIFCPLAMPVLLDGVGGPPQPGHIDEVEDDVVDNQPLSEEIPGRSRECSDDRPVFLEKRVEQGRFADVRPADDGQGDPFGQWPGRPRSSRRASRPRRPGKRGLPVGRGARPEVLLREFESGLDPGEEGDELVAQPEDPPGQAAPELTRRDPGLGQRDRPDQVVDGLGLEDVQAAVQIGPEGEFPWPGQPRPCPCPDPEDGLEDGRAAVGAQLDDVLPRIGPGRLEIGQEGFVERPPTLGIADRPENRPPHRKRSLDPALRLEDPPGHGERPLAADPDDPQPADPRRRRDRDDGIFEHVCLPVRFPILDDPLALVKLAADAETDRLLPKVDLRGRMANRAQQGSARYRRLAIRARRPAKWRSTVWRCEGRSRTGAKRTSPRRARGSEARIEWLIAIKRVEPDGAARRAESFSSWRSAHGEA